MLSLDTKSIVAGVVGGPGVEAAGVASVMVMVLVLMLLLLLRRAPQQHKEVMIY